MLIQSPMQRVFDVFCRSPIASHSLLGLSRDVGLAHPSVTRELKRLIDLGIVGRKDVKQHTRILPTYFAHRDHPRFRQQKALANLRMLYDSGLVRSIADTTGSSAIVLFGSFCIGDDVEGSDIDLFVQAKRRDVILSSFEKKLGRCVQLHFYPDVRKISAELRNNIINGIVLQGYLQMF